MKRRRSRIAVNATVIVLGLGAGVFASLKPWQEYREQRAAAERQMAATRAAERDRAALLHTQAEATSPVGQEMHARRLGYVRPGQQLDDSP